MLRMVLGLAGSGRTGQLVSQMRRRAAARLPSIYLVPEQFSSSAEALIYHTLGDMDSAFVEVVSFRTLAERIFKVCGAPGVPTLTDAGRVVYMRRALDAVGDELRTYARQKRSAAFCAGCADVINEFKTAGATPADVRAVGKSAHLAKLDELALIFEAYEGVLAQSAMDPQDKLALAAEKADCGYFTGKACFIDDFDGFTSPEYALIEAMLQYADSLTVALCCDGLQERDDGIGVFSPVRRTAQRLQRHAAKLGVPVAAPQAIPIAQELTKTATGCLNLALALGDDAAEEPQQGAVFLTNTPDEWEEVRFVAARMHELACQGVPYSRMAVICRDIAAYESAVRRIFGLFEIPYFTDATETPEYTAPVAFLRAALGIVRGGISSAPLMALLKTGLCGYAPEAVAQLENYVFTWSPKAADWRAPFAKNPDGLLAGENSATREKLSVAEALRADFIPKAEVFIAAAKNRSAAGLSKQLYLFMKAMGADKATARRAEALEVAGEMDAAEQARRAWDIAMGLLDEMAQLLGKERVPPAEYEDLLLLLVRGTDFGRLPQTMECAVFTAADRMRLDAPEYCFVLGACEGEFPMQVGYSGLLTHTDRDLLVGGGIQMPGSFENRTLLEEMVFYRALTAARKELYISWPTRRAGVVKSESAALAAVKKAVAPTPYAPPLALLCQTPGAAFDVLGSLYRQNSPEAAALYAALEEQPKGQDKLCMLQNVEKSGGFAVTNTPVLQALVGDELLLSATRAERYYECRFSYYMERVLGVRPRRKAEFSPMESGTFVHHLLEQVLAEAGEAFAECTDAQLAEMAARHADEFITENLPERDARSEHLLGEVKSATTKLLCYLRDAAAQSGFTIDAVELPIGGKEEGAIPPLRVQTPTGKSLRVVGKIDRVDVMRRDGKTYICIVDYKTGTKKFDLTDVYCGLNMQMMIYMQTLLKNGAERYENPVPAGVLYLTGDPAPLTGARDAAGGSVYEVDGILLDDAGVLAGLDAAGEGLFLPFKHRAGKPLRAGKRLADAEKLGRIGQRVEELLLQMAEGVYGGEFSARPLVKNERRPCAWCAYRAACRHEDGRGETPVAAPEGVFDAPGENDEGGECHA